MKQFRHWAAKWIWESQPQTLHSHILFRKDFTLAAASRGQLFISVETFGKVFINGEEVLRTASLSYPGQQNYQTVDLSSHLVPGVNRVAVLAWHVGVGCTSTWLKDPGLLFEIEIDESATRIGSDETWRCLPLHAWSGGARSRMFNLDLMEILDYRQLPDGFPFPHDESLMRSVSALPWPGVRMGVVEPMDFPAPHPTGDDHVTLLHAARVRDRSEEFAIPALAVSHEALQTPLSVAERIEPPPAGEAVTLVYALDGYHLGTPRLELNAPAGTIIDLSWCETLTDHHFDARPNHPWTTDRYILREGANTIVPEEWKAGRYLQLTFRRFDRAVELKSVQFVRESYPLTHRVRLSSSDAKLNQIFKIGLRSAALCMHDRIMDCPWRERRQWIGDVQRIGLVNYYSYDDRALIRNALKQQARLQDPTGRMWVCIPLMEEFPTQSMEWVRAILEYDHYTADHTLAHDLADNVEWLHRWFLKCRSNDGLFFNPFPPVQNWMDNTLQPIVRDHQFTTPFLCSNLRYLMFLDDITVLLDRHGQEANAQRAREERAELAGRIVDSFLDQSTGLLRECADPAKPLFFSEYGAAMAINANLPGFDAAAHWDRYTAFTADPRAIPTSPFGKFQTFEALGKLGRVDAILDQILRHWGPMVDAGSDTAWEWFDRGSQCHGWSGIPVIAVLRDVLHIDPRRPHHARRENVGGIAWIESHCDTAMPGSA